MIPNGKIIAGNIINYSREPVRRNEFGIGVAYDSGYRSGETAAHDDYRVRRSYFKDREEMTVRLNELGASSINFVVRVWSKAATQNVYWDVLERIKREDSTTPLVASRTRRWTSILNA
ncbi:mechanosensitive ion channel [Salmonella enterica subsp. enterica]|nr:mechanosensitive ion channel [Salmonella enterica subsp. enterica]